MYKHQEWMKDLDHAFSYWGNNGWNQEMANLLKPHVPSHGKATHPAIEVFRNLQNFYYDRYNNGHCNPCKTKCAVPVRAFMKKHNAPSHLKFKIGVPDCGLEESCDWVIAKCYELFVNKEVKQVKKVVMPQFGEVVEMNDGTKAGVINTPFVKDGHEVLFHAFSHEKAWLKCSEIKRVVPSDELTK